MHEEDACGSGRAEDDDRQTAFRPWGDFHSGLSCARAGAITVEYFSPIFSSEEVVSDAAAVSSHVRPLLR